MPDQKFNIKRPINYAWLFKMAWRDSRKSRSRLFLFISSIVLGIAALVAVYSFRDNLQRDIDNQAKELTGADLMIESRRAPKESVAAMLDTLGEQQAREKNFASMIYFIKGTGSRLIQVRALEGNYPFYGEIKTRPAAAAKHFKQGRNALVDKTTMLQFNAVVGDSIKIGSLHFAIAGSLESVPGQSAIANTVAPVVYIPLQYLEQTGLDQVGSRIQYRYFYKYDRAASVERDLKRYQRTLNKEGLDHETVATKKASTGRAFGNLNKFLALSGFIALLLGCVGVGSAIHVYIKEKLGTIATLRCLGLNAGEAFLIYLIQIAVIGLIGAVAGAVIGTLVQFALPAVLQDFIPIDISIQISWTAIAQGLAIGLIISILFALPSLLSVRNISPLNAIRASFDTVTSKRDFLKWLVYLIIVLFVYGFTYLQMNGWLEALLFMAGLLIAFLLLVGLSKLLMLILKKSIPDSMSYLWRQGFANLHRPNNQTLLLTVSIGLSTVFIVTLYLVQGVLLNKVSLSSDSSESNMVMFDIQTSQREQVATMTRQYQLPVMAEVPIVTMRIEEINGKTAAELDQADSLDQKSRNLSTRAFKGEIRATYQDSLRATEELVEGKWTGVTPAGGVVKISLEKGYAERIHVKVGDQIVFNVQGLLLPTEIGSLRVVDWNTVKPNFRVVFPTGVLEQAPQFYVLMTHVPSEKVSADFQGAVVKKFPNVSIINLGLVLQVLNELLSKINFVIRFMAGFSMATGWIVLLSAVMSSKGQRLRESVLLRTMGANRKQILTITALEYLFLGILASAAGIILAVAASWAVAVFSLNSTFAPDILPLLLFFILIPILVMVTGIYSSRSVLNHPPLEILRKEA
ncbi:ABC transporter permease [Pedobacter caeni]|uniref:Putative ABC transport system permease protein n=1 Tax=Pedobacter caeni TaxID=288992 RepID=A0A1M4USL2_9SPHI|nr:FtsX-like permease family protein [Pedobacter caeni]SHE59603.1 putative ABC transport system permease protein [Pedobacter caeni]